MKKYKRAIAAIMALSLSFAATACANANSSESGTGAETDSETFEEAIEVNDTDKIAAIPEDAEKELEWLSYFDINPSKGSKEKRVDLDLFEKKGGKIKYSATSSMQKYDQLASRLLSNDPPDLFWFEQKMTYPVYCVKGMFQPVDDIVDFDSELWADMKGLGDQFMLGDKHFVAPIDVSALSVMTYDKDVIQANGLDDPYDLYMEGNWTWNEWYDIMDNYVSGSDGEEERFGVTGWFGAFFFQSTGKTLIQFDKEKNEYVSNIYDPDFDRAAAMLYDVQKNGLYYSDWKGSAQEAFKDNILFYGMGTWAVTPHEGDNWGIVPMPRDPNSDDYYTTIGVTAYMWVKGSDKADAVKTWYECARVAATDPEYTETGKEKFFVSQPYWTEEMFEMANVEPISDKYIKLVDPGYGISNDLSNDDAATNPTKEAIIPYMYSSVMKTDENGKQFTWTQLRETYSSTIESELKSFNEEYHKFLEEQN